MWILPKKLKQSFQSALEAQGSTEALNLPSDTWAEEASRSLMWRGKHTPPKSWLRAWTKNAWVQRLSTRTLPSSTDDRLLAWWTASLGGIPASPSHLLESAWAQTTPDTSGPTSKGSSSRSTLGGASSRTCAGICLSEHTMSSATFKAWAIALRRDSTRRKKSERLTSEKGCSFWPTPTVNDSKNNGGPHQWERNSLALNVLAKQPPWIRCQCCEDYWCRDHDKHAHQCDCPEVGEWETPPYSIQPGNLHPQFVEWLMGWPDGWTDSGCLGTE